MKPRRMVILLDVETDLPKKKLRSAPAWQAVVDAAKNGKKGKLKIVRVNVEPVEETK